MVHTLHIKAFFFNAQTDYLPYYKHFTLKVSGETTAKELLGMIQEQNFNFSYPKQKLIMRINGWVVEAKEPVANIVERLGTELTIEPAKIYRSVNGLKMNDDDFMQSYALLEPYATESDLKYYKTLYALHYASETENFDHSYIGDAILVLAHKMISEGNPHKQEILQAISDVECGLLECEYENNLFRAQSHDAAITALKDMLKSDDNEHPTLLDMLKERFGIASEPKAKTTPTPKSKSIAQLDQKRIAYYAGNQPDYEEQIEQLIEALELDAVQMERKYKLSGLSILEDAKTIALKKAGATLLSAYDAGAEVMIVDDEACYAMLEKHFGQIEDVMGRKLLGFELISAKDALKVLDKVAA